MSTIIFGAPGGIRTLNFWLLKPATLPGWPTRANMVCSAGIEPTKKRLYVSRPTTEDPTAHNHSQRSASI